MEDMIRPAESNSIMYQDYMAKRPMEVETYLGSPIKLAQSVGLKVPRIETLYALLHHANITNQQKPREQPGTQAVNGNGSFPTRLSSAPLQPRPPMNGTNGSSSGMPNGMGRGQGGRTSSMGGPPPRPMVPGMRRGGPMNGPPNGYGRPMPNGYGPPGGRLGQHSRRGSIENDLGEEFSHVVLYEDIPEGSGSPDELALRERELMIRQREIQLREHEMRMRRGPPPRRGPPTASVRNGGFEEDEDDEEEYFDPTSRPAPQLIDPDNFDMMSVTSKRTRKAPNNHQIRNNPEAAEMGPRRGGGYNSRPPAFNRNRSSARLIANLPGAHDSIMDDPLMAYSSNRYGAVDRQSLGQDSRAASLTSARLDELQFGGPHNAIPGGPYPRHSSQSPGYINSPPIGGRGNGRPSPPNGYMNGYPAGGRTPPGGMRQPIPQYPPGQGNAVMPQQVEQHAGVSALNPPKGPMNKRSLTGSASASAGSGDNLDSENSAHSSQSSLGPRLPMGVR